MKTPEWLAEPEPVTLYINTYSAKSKRGVLHPSGVRVAAGLSPEPHHYRHTLDMQTYISPEGVHVTTVQSDGRQTHHELEVRNSFMITNPVNDPEAALSKFLRDQSQDEMITSFWGLERAIALAEELRAETGRSTTDRKHLAVFQLLPDAIDRIVSISEATLPVFGTISPITTEKPYQVEIPETGTLAA